MRKSKLKDDEIVEECTFVHNGGFVTSKPLSHPEFVETISRFGRMIVRFKENHPKLNSIEDETGMTTR